MINPISAVASIGTAETDSILQNREWQKGRRASVNGAPVNDCPWKGGLTRQWWLDGYYNRNWPVGHIVAQAKGAENA